MSVFDRIELADLRVFLTIMRTRSFKAAAIQLGLTPSAASHAMRRLEERLGAKLLNRSSRAVAPTDTGLALAARLEEGFDTIGHALAEIDAPGAGRFGELRINVFADAAHLMIAPALPEFARLCPHVKLTVVVEDRPIDIVAGGYDAGIRYGDYVPEDMIAVPLSGPQRWVVAGSPDYLARHGVPQQLGRPGAAQLFAIAAGRQFQLSLGTEQWRERTEAGQARHPRAGPDHHQRHGHYHHRRQGRRRPGLSAGKPHRAELAEGSLRVVLDEFAARGEPFHMYYSSRRHNHPALRTLVDIIRRQQSLGELR